MTTDQRYTRKTAGQKMDVEYSERTGLIKDDDEELGRSERDNGKRRGESLDYEEAISKTGYGWFHYKLVALCGWAVSSDAVEILSVSFVLPPASCDLHLTSSDKGWINSSVFIGMLFGGYLWGNLADIFGRRSVLLWSLTLNAIGGLASSLSQTFWLFLLMRLVSGIGVGGSLPVIFTYFAEFQPKNKRGSMISVLATFWMGGNILAAALAWLVIPHSGLGVFLPDFVYNSWRIYLSLCMLPALTSALLLALMPESPKFLMEKGKESEAMIAFKTIFTGNNPGATFPDNFKLLVTPRENQRRNSQGGCLFLKRTLTKFFYSTVVLYKRPLRRTMIIMTIIYFTLSFGYYGLFMWFPELFQRIERYGGSACAPVDANFSTDIPEFDICQPVSSIVYLEGFLTALSNLPGNIFTIIMIDKLGRRSLLTTSMILSGLCVFLIYFMETRLHNILLSCLFSGISVVGWNTLDVLGAELWPTSYRSSANGVLTGVGRVASILGNLAFGLLVEKHCIIPMCMVAALLSIGGLSALGLPNTVRIDLL